MVRVPERYACFFNSLLNASNLDCFDNTPPMNVLGFHHVAIIASEYQRSKDFYTRILGFSVLAENFRKDRDSYKLDLSGPGNIQIELFSFPDTPHRVSNPEACGLRHLAFAVADIEVEVCRLNSLGVDCETIREDGYTGSRYVFFSDPDGLPIELYEVESARASQ